MRRLAEGLVMERNQQGSDSGTLRPRPEVPTDASPPPPPEKGPGRPVGAWSASSLVVGIVVGLLVGSAATAAAMSSRADDRVAAALRDERSEVAAEQDSEAIATEAVLESEAARLDGLLTSAFESCGGPEGIEVTDAGRTMLFDVEGDDEYSGASIDDLACMLFDLDIPDSTIANMEQTTSMDGRQSDEWDDFGITWSYHPDRGLDGVITVIDP